jgi:hypothetical protein
MLKESWVAEFGDEMKKGLMIVDDLLNLCEFFRGLLIYFAFNTCLI